MRCETISGGDVAEFIFKKGDTRTDYANGAPILISQEIIDDEGLPAGGFEQVESGEYEQIETIVDMWQEALDAGAIMLTDNDKAATAKTEARQAAKQIRDQALAALTYTFADGREIQTRLGDQALIQSAIAYGGDEWVLADNTVAWVSAEELSEALSAAVMAVKSIFDDYKAELNA